ncbi:histidinol phosphate phosphatase [Clostridium botulinum]|nr:histidinol phosphate phosphatase [Clostridium botulinum]MBY6853062.1 histidinol phosphate phosphatase [Clostridium botulinum]NFF22866.1 histidinol phosphate phosphatase [Clostridium botulinum]NFF36579.1 histidinol phosphate phosphatase [Clostridium botulinum]NFI48370.1 histidinol phosphate phosphatase [Clostridium botulinum]
MIIYISKAKELNIGLILTEHLDQDYPDKNLFKLDIPNYFNNYSEYKINNLLLGIELGLTLPSFNIITEKAKNFNYDFILGSVHAVYDEDIYIDYCKRDDLTKKEFFHNYLEFMLNVINKYDCFDSLAHFDYPCRYTKFENNEIALCDHHEILDEIFKTLISKGKVLEINTRRLDTKGTFNNMIDIYNRYKELGGKYITLGSDAHNVNAIATNFKNALSLTEILGLKPIYFKNRKPEFF